MTNEELRAAAQRIYAWTGDTYAIMVSMESFTQEEIDKILDAHILASKMLLWHELRWWARCLYRLRLR